mmetsp:Transcript_214/g.237  ORF Transcript_214/g.237 Transcript_214/m.237 type:complete len:106 (+) Transcript_214:258-575(+)
MLLQSLSSDTTKPTMNGTGEFKKSINDLGSEGINVQTHSKGLRISKRVDVHAVTSSWLLPNTRIDRSIKSSLIIFIKEIEPIPKRSLASPHSPAIWGSGSGILID